MHEQGIYAHFEKEKLSRLETKKNVDSSKKQIRAPVKKNKKILKLTKKSQKKLIKLKKNKKTITHK